MIFIALAVWIILILWIAIAAVPGFLTAVFVSTLISITLYFLMKYLFIFIGKQISKLINKLFKNTEPDK